MKLFKRLKKESGAYTVFTAILLTVLVGFLAMSVDIGYHYYRGAKLQNATDAAATAVAGNLGTIDTQLEEIAYQYLAKNGFPDREKVHCTIEARGETTFETVDSDDYIKAGYYKLTVWADDDTFFANLLDIDSLRLVKYAYVKADAKYVSMPKALGYTVFAGSTKGTASNPALQINGKTGGIINTITSFTQWGINGINNWVVKPIQAFDGFDIGTWWNPSTWKLKFNWDDANSWQAKLSTSKLTTSGDVHSNSNIVSRIQSINANRIQDTDFTHSASYDSLAKFYGLKVLNNYNENGDAYNGSMISYLGLDNIDQDDIQMTVVDYGQVTFDAVKDITFIEPSGYSISGDDHKMETYYYVQNQQYLEQTQLTMRILDLIDLDELSSDPDSFRRLYEEAADIYLVDKIATTEQKNIIKNQVASGNLTYDIQTHEFTLKNQANIIYSVNAKMANDALYVAYDDSGVGIDKMLFGRIEDDEDEYSNGIALVGNDLLYKSGTNVPYYAQRNASDGGSTIGDEYDKLSTMDDMIDFITVDEKNDQTINARLNVTGNVINREYQDFAKAGISIQDATRAGANFAIARTFIENSEYIDMPNLKPYFIRQINKSIRNATKIKEKINVSSAGQPTVRYAAKERTDTLKSYQENLNYYDDTYRAKDSNTINLTQTNTHLFREFKESKNSRVINLNNTVKTYNRTTQDGLNYSFSISRYTYKGYNLYKDNRLKTPSEFFAEKLAEREETKPDGADAVKDFYDTTAKTELNMVAAKRIELENNSSYSYSAEQSKAENAINDEVKPNINKTIQDDPEPQIDKGTIPATGDVFLGYGKTGNNVEINRTSGQRKIFDDFIRNLGVTISTDTFTIPNFSTSGMTSGGSLGGKIKNGATQYFENNHYYSSASTPYTQVVWVTGRYNMETRTNGTSVVTGNITMDNGIQLIVNSGSTLKVGGSISTTETKNNKIYVKAGAKLIVRGDITCEKQDQIYVEAGGTLVVQGQIKASGSDSGEINVYGTLIQLTGSKNIDSNYINIYSGGIVGAVGGLNSNRKINVAGGTLYVLGNIVANNDKKDDNMMDITGTSNIYVRGYVTSGHSDKQHIYIHDGTNTVFSILGEGSTDCFNGKCNQIHAYNNSSGNKIYLGKNTTIKDNNENLINGTISCYGNLTFDTTGGISLIGAGTSYITGNLNATNTSELTVSNGHVLYVLGGINVKKITTNNSKIHADGNVTVSGALNLQSNSELEAFGAITYGTSSVSGGSRIIWPDTINFEASPINGNNIDELKYVGNVSSSSMSLNKVKLKIEGNLTLTGDLVLNNYTTLYVTGNLTCKGISLSQSKLYVEGNVSCTSISETNTSLFLVRKGNTVGSSYSSINCSGKVFLSGSSKLLDEGNLTATAVDSTGSKVYAYRALNITANYSAGSTGYFSSTGSASEIFCGDNSSSTNTIGIVATGSLYYPYKSGSTLNCNHLEIGTNGKVIIDGAEGNPSCRITDWAYIANNGIFCNHGKTTVVNCRITNDGKMYLLGGEDVTSAGKTDMRGDVRKSNPDNFYFNEGSESFLGKSYNGSTKQSALEYISAWESWGDVYIDTNVTIKGHIQDYVQNILGVKTEKGGQSYRSDDWEIRVGHLGTSMYIGKGNTYIDGKLVTYEDASKDSGIQIGKFDKSNNDAGLIVNGDIDLATAVINYGKFIIRGTYNLNTSNRAKVTEKNDSSDYKKGKSIVNGRDESDYSPVFFVGNYNADGTIKNANASTDFWGYVENYGKLYFNHKLTSIKGYNDQMKDGDVCDDFAFINYSGSKAHFGGAVRLNSNQLFNKWKNGTEDTVFTCDGKLTYGGCVFNCGTMVVKGDMTNNETNSETDNGKKYVNYDHFSVMNGFTNLDKSVRENFVNRVYPNATLFCGGKLEVGITEQGGESGSIISCGTMYINGDMNIYTNASSFKLTLQNFTNFWKNPESHSYFRTALWLYDNSNTFVGGNCFAGAGVATGKDSIFMVGGDYRSKRSTKLGIQMFMGTSGALGITLLDDYMSYKENTGDDYNSAYFYVGGNALVNTIGSTVKAFGVVTAPENNSRDMDIYPNTNIYIGGSLYANCKVYMKTNTDMVVAGKKTFYDSNGNLSGLIYTSMFTSPRNFVPEKNLSNGLTVRNHLNANKNMKFYVYQDFDMSPNSSMVVNGAMQVNETSKIRDMTKSYVYGSFTCGKYVELGKSLNDMDFSDIVTFGATGESIAKDSSGNYKYLTDEEIAYIGTHGENKFLAEYDFDKSAYMFVNGDFSSGQDLGTGVLNIFDKIKKWITNTFLSTGYTKVYASSALKVNGNLTSSRYITLRHDAKVYCKGNMDAATSIEGGIYSEWYVGGHMEAATSSVTSVIDAIGGLLNITSRGKIEFFDQTRVIVGGNMYSSASIDIGGLQSNGYTRGRKSNYTVQAPEGSNSYYETDSDFQEALILTYDGSYKDKSGAAIYLDGSTYKYSDYKDSDNKNIEFGSKDKVVVYNSNDGKYHKNTYNGDVVDYSDGAQDQAPTERTPDTNNGLDSVDEPDNFGAEVFCQGSMIAQNGHIKEYAYTSAVVGDYVYAPDYITLRSNADLWVLPETFNNETYVFLPYPDKPEDRGGFFSRLWNNISYYIGKFAYETGENFKFQSGSCYTFGNLTLNKNASLMGTNDLLQLGTINHADDSSPSAFEKFLSDAMGFLTPRKVVLREDSLILFGSNVTIASSPISLNLDVLAGEESVAGFDSKGIAVHPGYQYTCTNHDINGPHKGYNYTMTVDQDEHNAIQNGSETLVCDICGQTVKKNKYKIVQVSHPAVIYAGNDLTISTTVDMLMTYLIADQGNVNLNNFYTKTAYDEHNLKELPNAISSYNGDIIYTAWVGQLSSLFYAPVGNVLFDGIYTDIYGSVVGNTVEMNAYYQNFHRFNNWRTMDLHIAESGNVYLIPESRFNAAPPLGQTFDLTSGTQYQNSPYGVRIFF